MQWQSLGGEKNQYTWDEGWSTPFLKSCRGLGEMARRGHWCQGYFTSRALMSCHWPLSDSGKASGRLCTGLKKSENEGELRGEGQKWESDVPISPSQMLG